MSTVFGGRLGAVSDRLRALTGNPTFPWRGLEVPCVVNTYARGTILVEGGFEVEADTKIYVRKTDFLTVDSTLVTIDSELFTVDDDRPTPVAGKALVLGGKRMRIVRTHDPIPTDAEGSWVLYLIDVNK